MIIITITVARIKTFITKEKYGINMIKLINIIKIPTTKTINMLVDIILEHINHNIFKINIISRATMKICVRMIKKVI